MIPRNDSRGSSTPYRVRSRKRTRLQKLHRIRVIRMMTIRTRKDLLTMPMLSTEKDKMGKTLRGNQGRLLIRRRKWMRFKKRSRLILAIWTFQIQKWTGKRCITEKGTIQIRFGSEMTRFCLITILRIHKKRMNSLKILHRLARLRSIFSVSVRLTSNQKNPCLTS